MLIKMGDFMINFEKIKEKLKKVKPADIGQNIGVKAATAIDFAKNLVENEKVKEQAGKVRVVAEEVQKGFLSGWKEVKSQAEKNKSPTNNTSDPFENNQNSNSTVSQEVPDATPTPSEQTASKPRTRKSPAKRSAAKKTLTKVVVQQAKDSTDTMEKPPIKRVRKSI